MMWQTRLGHPKVVFHLFNIFYACGLRYSREEEPDESAAGMKSITSFMVQPKKKMRSNFFVERGLELVDTF